MTYTHTRREVHGTSYTHPTELIQAKQMTHILKQTNEKDPSHSSRHILKTVCRINQKKRERESDIYKHI